MRVILATVTSVAIFIVGYLICEMLSPELPTILKIISGAFLVVFFVGVFYIVYKLLGYSK